MTRLNFNLNNAAQQLSMWNIEELRESPVFTSNSAESWLGLNDDTLKVLEHLQAGKSITFVHALDMGIKFLNKHIDQLRQSNVTIYCRSIRISGAICSEYSLSKFEQ